VPSSKLPWLAPTPRKLKVKAIAPAPVTPLTIVRTTLLFMSPPRCG
jgi:hypothetical protein